MSWHILAFIEVVLACRHHDEKCLDAEQKLLVFLGLFYQVTGSGEGTLQIFLGQRITWGACKHAGPFVMQGAK